MSYHDNSADEDDDDYGGYFLRPVNEYKIADKIVLANKELFGDDPSLSTDATSLVTLPAEEFIDNDGVSSPICDDERSLSFQNERLVARRVTFRYDLEDFEPDFITDNEDDDDAGTQADESISESDEEVNSDRIKSIVTKEKSRNQTMDIRKDNEITIGSTDSTNPVIDNKLNTDDCAEEIIDEVCEEIEGMTLSESLSPDIVKQVLSVPHQENEYAVSASSASDSDDSQISPNASVTYQKSFNEKVNPEIDTDPSYEDSHILPPQQKSAINPCKHNRQVSSSSSTSSSHQSSVGSSNRTHSAILKIQLNFKPCCEYKHLETNRLPRYCGYFSQYGLSKEQLERRDVRRERSQGRKNKRIERKAEEENMKSRINEEAFENWLRLKMRNRQSSTRNMYDVKQQKNCKNSKPNGKI